MCEILPIMGSRYSQRVAGFIAQCGHESGGFRVLSENLNYSAQALNTIFPNILEGQVEMQMNTPDNPEKIANVICKPMDNGDSHSGDGWRS